MALEIETAKNIVSEILKATRRDSWKLSNKCLDDAQRDIVDRHRKAKSEAGFVLYEVNCAPSLKVATPPPNAGHVLRSSCGS